MVNNFSKSNRMINCMNQFCFVDFQVSKLGYLISKNSHKIGYLKNENKNVHPHKHRIISVVEISNGQLYAVLWSDEVKISGIWFVDSNLNYIKNNSLTVGSLFVNGEVIICWLNFLNEIILKVWNSYFLDVYNRPVDNTLLNWLHPAIKEDLTNVLGKFPFRWTVKPFEEIKTTVIPNSINYLYDQYAACSLDSRQWQDNMIADGCIRITSPIDGTLVDSLGAIYMGGKTVFYLFKSQGEFFFLICSGFRSLHSGYYFPNKNSLFSNDKFINDFGFDNFFMKLIESYLKQINYLFNGIKKSTMLIAYKDWHFGHYLWNDLSAIDRLSKVRILNNVSDMVLIGHDELYGDTQQLFPEFKGKLIYSDANAIRKIMINDNKIPVVLGDSLITESLAKRLLSHSNKQLGNNAAVQKIFNFIKKEHFDITIFYTIRLDNRFWVDQIDGIIQILKNIETKCRKKICLIVDGKNSNETGILKSFSEKKGQFADLVDKELLAAERIKTELTSESIKVINTINCSLFESLILSSYCDFFIAPWGAGLVKTKWINNKPGIIYTSKYNLYKRADLKIYESNQFRENATVCRYVNSDFIEDLIDTNTPERANFRVNQLALEREILSMIYELNLDSPINNETI